MQEVEAADSSSPALVEDSVAQIDDSDSIEAIDIEASSSSQLETSQDDEEVAEAKN